MKKITAILLCIVILIGTVGCVGPGEVPQKDESTVTENESEVKKDDLTQVSISDVEALADNSGSMWELMCKLFPDYLIFKDEKGNFTKHKVNKNLKLDTYDWSSLAGTWKGIDVSKYQGTIAWDKVKEFGIQYAIIRVGYRGYTQGTFQEDPKFAENITGALENDIPVGVYFVTKAVNAEEGKEEAQYVLEKIKPYKVTWPVVIDIEPSNNIEDRTAVLSAAERTDAVLAFCEEIKNAGYVPMIYGGIGTFMKYLEFERLEGIEKWFAMYFNQPYLRYEFGIWQATESGNVLGINGNVDIDYSIKDYGAAN